MTMFKKKEETLQYLSIKCYLKFKKKERKKTIDETDQWWAIKLCYKNCALLKTSSKNEGKCVTAWEENLKRYFVIVDLQLLCQDLNSLDLHRGYFICRGWSPRTPESVSLTLPKSNA